jgi:DNA adenine methylase
MTNNRVKPFVKWAGGKSKLLNEIELRLRYSGLERFTYVEPFAGGGAVLFWILEKYPMIKKAVINDTNSDLVNAYRTVADYPVALIASLGRLQEKYYSLNFDLEGQKEFYYEKRELFNERSVNNIDQSSLMIFLNKTCFNGLYRVNRGNGFNVPMGRYKTPTICDAKGLTRCSELLQKVIVLEGDYRDTFKYASPDSLFYMDPPYRPLNSTSNFNSYAKDAFNDESQVALRNYCDKLTEEAKCLWLLSNSDMKNVDEDDNFFDDLYKSYYIDRVSVSRSINSNASKRGAITELMINNYGYSSEEMKDVG